MFSTSSVFVTVSKVPSGCRVSVTVVFCCNGMASGISGGGTVIVDRQPTKKKTVAAIAILLPYANLHDNDVCINPGKSSLLHKVGEWIKRKERPWNNVPHSNKIPIA